MTGVSLQYPEDDVASKDVHKFWEGDGWKNRRLSVQSGCEHGTTGACSECVAEATRDLNSKQHQHMFAIPVAWVEYTASGGAKTIEVRRLKCAYCESEKER